MAETHQISLPMEATPQAPPPLEETPQTLLSVQPQRAAPVEATQQEKPAGKQRRGRQKIPMQRIHNDNHRLVTFSKRKAGIFNKGAEISTRCGTAVGILIFSPTGKPYAFGAPNIESIADRFLRRVNPEAQNDNLPSRIAREAQRRAHVVKLNNDCDVLSVYLQNMKKEGDKPMELKKQTFDDGDCWWDIPVEDLTVDHMLKMTLKMEEIKENARKRLSNLRVGASSSLAVVQPEDIQMGGNEGFGYVGDGGFEDFTEGGSLSAVTGVEGGVMQMGGNLGQGYAGGADGRGGFGDWRAGGSTAAGIHGGGFQLDGNGGLCGYGGLGDWGASSSVQAGVMRAGGGIGGDFTAGGSSSVSVQQRGMQVGRYRGGGFCGGDVAGGGIGLWRPVGSAVASSAGQPGVGGGGDDDWWAVVSSMMQIGGIGGFGYNSDIDDGGSAGGAGGGLGIWGAGGASSSSPLHPNPTHAQMGGNVGLDYGGFGGGGDGEFVGGGGGYGDFTASGLSAVGLHPDQDHMGGTSNGGSFYDDGGGFGTNNRFGDFLGDGGGKII